MNKHKNNKNFNYYKFGVIEQITISQIKILLQQGSPKFLEYKKGGCDE